MLAMIDNKLLVQWYVAGLLPRICSPLHLYEITNYEDVLQKEHRVDLDDEGSSTSSTMERLEEKIEHLQQTIKNISIQRNEVWCTTFIGENDNCPLNESTQISDVHRIQD
jgi:hypothetical protein